MSVNNEQSIKAILTVMLTITSARFKLLLPLVVVLAFLMVIDIIYGVRAVVYENKHGIKDSRLSSQTMLERLLKKMGQIILILVGLTIDVGIYYGAEIVGSTINIYPIFSLIMTISLIGKELLSIVENYTRCGNEPPAWLGALGTSLKRSAESKGDRYVKQIEKEITKNEQD